jgi:chaperonin GroES
MQNFLLWGPIADSVLSKRLLLPKLRSNLSGPSYLSSIVSLSNASNLKPYVHFFPPCSDERRTMAFLFIQKTASGIFLPTSATSSPLPEATVIAVGPGAPNKEGHVVPTAVKAGDRVLLPGWGGNAIKVGEEVRFFF